MQSSDDTTDTSEISEPMGSDGVINSASSKPVAEDQENADDAAAESIAAQIADEDGAPESDDPPVSEAAGEVDIALGEVRLDDSWRDEPKRPVIERFRPAIGLTAALALHVAVAAAGYASFAGITERIGGGGTDETSISVELITREALDAVRANRQPKPPELRRSANAAAIAPVQGTNDAQMAAEDMQDGAPPQQTEAPKPPAPRTAPIVAERPKPDQPGTLMVAGKRGPDNQVDKAPDTPSDDANDTSSAPAERTIKPTQSQVASQAQDAQTATVKGGAASRSLIAAAPPPTQPSAAEAALGAGRAARGYAAELVKALVSLEEHLQSRINRTQERERGRVELLLRLGRDGKIETLQIAQSSGRQSLDRQALRDVRSFRFPVPPAQLSDNQRTFKLPITYR